MVDRYRDQGGGAGRHAGNAERRVT